MEEEGVGSSECRVRCVQGGAKGMTGHFTDDDCGCLLVCASWVVLLCGGDGDAVVVCVCVVCRLPSTIVSFEAQSCAIYIYPRSPCTHTLTHSTQSHSCNTV